MKLIIQIPCFNEAESLPITLNGLPREVDGFDKVEWLVIDDGSTDNTVDVANKHKVDYIIQHTKNQGLAKSFMTGIDACINLGADVIVNTDADNQYNPKDIVKLVQPILKGKADIVVGARPIDTVKHFTFIKKALQKLGSWVVRVVSKADIPDAPSGFRAISREAALHLNVFNDYTYTLEMIIQVGKKNMAIMSVPIRVNEYLRPSRLLRSTPSYIKQSIVTIVRIFVVYKPFRFFMSIGMFFFALGFLMGLRFLGYYALGKGQGHIQSLILASIFLGIGFQTMLVAFVADLLAVNRRLVEDIQYRMRKIEAKKNLLH